MGALLSGSRVLVTGGAGFIGSHVVDSLLDRGAAVTVADNFATGRIDNLAGVADRISIERLNLAEDDVAPALVRGKFDHIIHAAGNANIPASVSDPLRDLNDNAVATLRLLEAVRTASSSTSMVFISSATVYAEGSEGPMSEDHPRGPISPYGLSKLASETYVAMYAHLYGLHTASVRIFSVFGPRLRKQVVWDFMKRLADNPDELVIHGDGTERRNPSHVQYIVDAILLVAERAPMSGDAYNVGSPDSVSINELARDIANAMGLNPKISNTGQRGAGHARTWLADITHLESLGYRPAVEYLDGLAKTVEWFKSDRELRAAGEA